MLLNQHGEPLKLHNTTLPLFDTSYLQNMFSSSEKFVPKKYTSYAAIVKAVRERYNNQSVLGSSLVQTAINYRLAYLFGNGAVVAAKGKKEQKWIDQFLESNEINTLFLREGMQNGETEGKNLIQLYVEDGTVKCRNINWSVTGYTVVTDDVNNSLVRVDFKNKGGKGLSLTPDECVYIRHGTGTPDQINTPVPVVGACLFEMDSVGYALADIRRNNSKFGFSFLHFQAKTAQEAEDLGAYLSRVSWQPGQALATTAQAELIAPKLEAAQIFEKEIQLNLQAISTKTGVPLYTFDIQAFSNRAVAYEIKHNTAMTMSAERTLWIVRLKELVVKAMKLANESDPSLRLRTDSVSVDLPPIDITQTEQIKDILLPLYDKKLISARTIVDQLPETSYDIEQERMLQEVKEEPVPVQPEPVQEPVLQVVKAKGVK